MTKLAKLTIETKAGPIELDLDEARELYVQLEELFSEKVKYIPSPPLVIEKPPWQPSYPYIWSGHNLRDALMSSETRNDYGTLNIDIDGSTRDNPTSYSFGRLPPVTC